ncbi:tRNA (uridine(34)/cytosine(34)/5-carboxymethylaminomethyluridine(34)-2'-O)-methyltransferase TrmL [Vulcanibacillus modesticaldus]|uniref:Putative tRNA (cytidine(34)-2'-O)-methyltransferase n=1 Tax=Vulcanibacillus modesticaldus TaxID=337097 RepID=A0A1D2YTG5_9BACI|nr:tRNA (uridine(34)/cytosine(34)/5-carboxymethylaminomethyluridine(34)-2'-O)-methyltransferase TrmL [Vulcanibacillus modesticaldus]OEF98988.1 tRNA (uridine(34)/cytosine(34)/5-carboxymethylaminomethyluridine(34)-2'-O)-methyltransferase TrmL [Vulcanibacillus modesticaldus]
MALNIVLHEPEIPANTGNIARTCAATGTRLHLIRPLGFSTDDKMLKRAGLDYWHAVEIKYYDSIQELYDTYPNGRFFYATTKTDRLYTDVTYQDEDFIVFGKETAGIPIEILNKNWEQTITIPMGDAVRSLNLSNSAAIVLYEALRQLEFKILS